MFKLLRERRLQEWYQIDVRDGWLYAAIEVNLPIFVPGWEDSSRGNMYAAHSMLSNIKNVHTVKTRMEYLFRLADWYTADVPCEAGASKLSKSVRRRRVE